MAVKPNSEKNAELFTFTVVLCGVTEITEHLEHKLGETGCDDASLACREGLVSLDFDREAESLSSAVGSAIDDVQAAGWRVASIQIGDRTTSELAAELSAWEAASDEDFESFESRME